MNRTVLMITVFLPLIPMMAVTLRSGAFGRGSVGMLFRLFFLGVLAAVPAFLMEAGGMLAVSVVLRFFSTVENFAAVRALLRYVLATALIEEAWKHFVLRSSTWDKMIMETVADGIAASSVVGIGFSAVIYTAWQVSDLTIPADMEVLRAAMPEFLHAGAVASFLFALLFIPSHFGYSGLMGALYGFAKGSEQKEHAARARFMLFVSCLIPVIVHGAFSASLGYGIGENKILWTGLGFIGEGLCALLIGMVMRAARDDMLADLYGEREERRDVDFADSEEFADFAEAAGGESDAVSPREELPATEAADRKSLPFSGDAGLQEQAPSAAAGEDDSPKTPVSGSFEALDHI